MREAILFTQNPRCARGIPEHKGPECDLSNMGLRLSRFVHHFYHFLSRIIMLWVTDKLKIQASACSSPAGFKSFAIWYQLNMIDYRLLSD